jgi:hypothetical protein
MSKNAYRGHRAEWNRDEGSVPGHPQKHPKMNAHSQSHTPFEARGFHEDRGSNTRPDRIHVAKANQHKEGPNELPINVHGGHDPRPAHYHKNSGTTSEGHMLIRRGASKMPTG